MGKRIKEKKKEKDGAKIPSRVQDRMYYVEYLEFRRKHAGPLSKASYLKWLENGKRDTTNFLWCLEAQEEKTSRGEGERPQGEAAVEGQEEMKFYLV